MISKELSLAALERWGLERQTNMAIEEIGEFLKDWNKMKRGAISESKYVEEMVDVYIMFSQLRHIYGEKFEKIFQEKIRRIEQKVYNYEDLGEGC